ncbi:L-lysine 6-monooxygenase (NADPH-requiring)-domain-containing protein [Epithele typhae]|uniref:L-lysine 6-monooxygenase (NADPH-requiring)-domain-containing protein n=1 Tax=Epithele typhae TaxID=378194 RepID=UPI0020080BD8|nr:L-lysine 6-monooxygenase (NADPH-requiring)-domain-containing protein [Epithele typhae]KAH9946103.1 L-lysine 6-monooxygenase (NADPH-requiring)-domain-containing protein [Epithele typhae]
MSVQSTADPAFDVIGLGFGPANVAIAGAVIEKWKDAASTDHAPLRRCLFIEKQREFRWHPGMLLPNSRMQISFLKDLATLRSPQSPITFLAYLHSQGRLVNFINRGSFTPTRREYADYLSWAAEYVQKQGIRVRYGEEVIAISRCEDGLVQVRSRDIGTGEEFSRIARNIVLSPGGTPRLPPALSIHWPHPRIIHSASYISSANEFFASLPRTTEPLRIAVIGAGQSATEVVLDLHSRLNALHVSGGRQHELDMIFRRGSVKPSDDTPFSNEIFDPASTDFVFGLPSQRDRQAVLREYNATNYSVVNVRTIDSLYEVMYHQNLLDGIKSRTGEEEDNNRTRITLCPHTAIYSSEMVPAHPDGATRGDAVRLTLHGLLSRSVTHRTYDAVFCGTGYDRDSWTRLLASSDLAEAYGVKSSAIELVAEGDAAPCEREILSALEGSIAGRATPTGSGSSDGFSTPPTPVTPHSHHTKFPGEGAPSKVRVSRTYRLLPEHDSKHAPRVYLQGCTQSTHGLSESLLSILGVRAGMVVDELCADGARQ